MDPARKEHPVHPGKRMPSTATAKGLGLPAKELAEALPYPPVTMYPPGMPLEEALARIALRTVYAGVAQDEAFLADVRAAGKFTPHLERLTQQEVPPEVRAWVRDNFFKPGVVREAVRSIMQISIRQFQTPLHTHEPDTSHCWPMCSPP